jgi:hypothetical protein
MTNEIPTPEPNSPLNNNKICNDSHRQFLDSSRQERTMMIEKLVETYANVIDSIWKPKYQPKMMPTRGFCTEILKRSKTTYSTLQVSLFYIFRIKRVVTEKLTSQQPADDLICCGRRMFLASLMVASKYLHDKNYHNKAWSSITGLDLKEINAAELAFLKLIDYKLYVSKSTFDIWYAQLQGHIQKEMKKVDHGYPSPCASPEYHHPTITMKKRTIIDEDNEDSNKKLRC